MIEINKRNTKDRCELRSNSINKGSKISQWRHSGVFIVNFENTLHLFQGFLLLTLNRCFLRSAFQVTYKEKTTGVLYKQVSRKCVMNKDSQNL